MDIYAHMYLYTCINTDAQRHIYKQYKFIKILEEKRGSNLFDLGHSNFLLDTSQRQGNKGKKELLGLHQDKRLLYNKGNHQKS